MINNRKFLSIVAITFSLSGLSNLSMASEAHAGDPEAGKTLSATCAGCHGTDGNSPAPSFPKIAGLGEKYLYKQLQKIQSKERDIAEMTGQLDGKSDKDLLDLAAYFNSQKMQLSGAKPLTVKVNSGAEVDGLKLGQQLFRAGNQETGTPACTGCHSPRGLGNDPAGFPRLSGQYPEYIAKQLRAYRAGERTTDGDSKIMRSVAELLSDAEIDSVANYIGGLN